MENRAEGLLSLEEAEALSEECRERLHTVETGLMDLAGKRIEASPEWINRSFRAFHSVKGAAGYLRYESLQEISHLVESVLSEVRDGKRRLTPSHVEVMLGSVDRMKQLLADGDRRVEAEYARDLDRLKILLEAGSSAVPAPTRAERRLRILVVEDDFTSRIVLQGLLTRHGECHVAVTGAEAVAAFRAARETGQPYDLVCMDIQLPELDGTEAVRQIRAIEEEQQVYSTAGVKIFMTTSIQDVKAVTASFRALCDAYLFKPIDGEKLEDDLWCFGLTSAR